MSPSPEVRSILPRKRVTLTGGLAGVVGKRPLLINALHRQAICQLGGGLRVAATDRNGIVQAIEHERLPFVVGVQWHPEYLPQLPRQRKLFRALVEAARRRSSSAVIQRYSEGSSPERGRAQRVLPQDSTSTRRPTPIQS